MPVLLDHLIVPSRDKNAGAQFLGELLGLPWEEARGEFAQVFVNDTLTVDFIQRDGPFESHHYCFSLSDSEFDAVFARIQERGLEFRSGPRGPVDNKINNRNGGKNLYWFDPDGHNWEILTVSYARQHPATATV
jgi:catechol 2,3-dioxygenase-like lactoylglutathione lyase family enzyme